MSHNGSDPICRFNMRHFIIFGFIAIGAIACAEAPAEEQEDALTTVAAMKALRGTFAVSGPARTGGAEAAAEFLSGNQFSTVTESNDEVLGGHGTYAIKRNGLGPVTLTLAYTSDFETVLPEGEYKVSLDGPSVVLVNRSVTPGISGERESNLFTGKRWTLSPTTVAKLNEACDSKGLPACGTGTFCSYASACGRTDVPGKCAAQPESCVGPHGFDPDSRVCGCDGSVYLNACRAAKAGVSVDYALPAGSTAALTGACPKLP